MGQGEGMDFCGGVCVFSWKMAGWEGGPMMESIVDGEHCSHVDML